MTWPPLWGHFYWNFLHSAAYHKINQTKLSPNLQKSIGRFLKVWCVFLPCSVCKNHCKRFNQSKPPAFKDGLQFWEYTVDFHNDVNARTKKRIVGYPEARRLLSWNLSAVYPRVNRTNMLDPGTLEESLPLQFWFVVIFATYIFTTSPRSTTPVEQQRLYRFMVSFFEIAPFSSKTTIRITSSRTVGEHILKGLKSGKDNGMLACRDKAQNLLLELYNSICLEFDHVPYQDFQTFSKPFKDNFTDDNFQALIRAQIIRREDHEKITQMERSARVVDDKHDITHDEGVTGDESMKMDFIVIVLSTCLVLSLFGNVVLYRGRRVKGES